VDATNRFEALVRGPEPAAPLDELALLVAAHAEPGLDIAKWLGALDELAARCPEPSFAGVMRHLAIEGFAGNRDDYYDPSNSYLHHVIERRIGIPITLSIIAIEVGRRIDAPIVGVAMPGHFLVRDAGDEHSFGDPFEGRLLDRGGCERAFAETVPDGAFHDEYLAPVGTRSIVARLLANLKGIYLARRDRQALASVLSLRVLVPGVPFEERRELASALAADGRYLEAAAVLDALAVLAREAADAGTAEEAERGATRLRARLN
jgi:regulator of sirC expression with transglutaminase-like and TPR domain